LQCKDVFRDVRELFESRDERSLLHSYPGTLTTCEQDDQLREAWSELVTVLLRLEEYNSALRVIIDAEAPLPKLFVPQTPSEVVTVPSHLDEARVFELNRMNL
jgi:hypothetical protein